ncbi:MAG: exonuclease [Acidobacteria bacterium]|nr:MAG: exonuclease [Acidobacteriota bacterium]MCC6781924.1 exonuclease [Planctomycetota bacterium]
MRGDLYVSVDIEADGPIPGPYSMLAFGLAVAASFDGSTFSPRDPTAATFYRELRPISDDYDPEALRVAGLDRELLAREGGEPATAMREAAKWLGDQEAALRPVLVGYPVVFDWMFMHWYFVRFLGESPFGFSGALDMKTMYQQKITAVLDRAGRSDLPPEIASDRPHTHNALDDAIEQAEIFNRLYGWDGATE